MIKKCVCGKEFIARNKKTIFHSWSCKRKEQQRQGLIQRKLKLLRRLLALTDSMLESAEEMRKTLTNA